jgi:hypothetical protein
MPQALFNPEKWLTTFTRALKDYVINGALPLNLYEIIMEYPGVLMTDTNWPRPKTVIHFSIEDIEQMQMGMGSGVVNEVFSVPPLPALGEVVEEWEAHPYRVTLDVGIWASKESGGSTARMEAREALDLLFVGPKARTNCMTLTDGIEILSFTGGRFVEDEVNNLPVFRAVDQDLIVRLYGRLKAPPVPVWDTFVQEPGIEIDDTVIVSG